MHERIGAPPAEPCAPAQAALVSLLQTLVPEGEQHDLRDCGIATLPLAQLNGTPTNASPSHDAPTAAEEEKALCP
jgi:hypothetical protein